MALLRDDKGKISNASKATDKTLSEVDKETLATLKQLNVEKAKGLKIDEDLRKTLVEKLKSYRKELKLREDASSLIDDEIDGAKEALSIAKKMSRNQALIRKQSNKTAQSFNAMEGLVGKIGLQLDKQSYKTKEGAAAAREANKAMGSYSDTVTKAMREFKKGKIDANALASRIKYADEEMDSFLDTLDLTNKEAAKLYAEMKSVVGATQEMNKAFAKGKVALSDTKKGLGDIGSAAAGGIPGVSGLISALSSIGTMGTIGAIIALGLALSELIGYVADAMGIKGLSGMNKVGIEMQKELTIGIAQLNGGLSKTAMQLGQNVQLSGAMKANMVKLGVSAEDFVSATTNASNNLGLMGKDAAAVGADIAMYSKRTGASADDLDKIANSFRLVGNLSGKAASDSLGMAESIAKATGVPVNAMFKDLAESSELFLQNNYGNEKSMIRQVATLRVMGVAAQKVLQAGQNMVLNYKDSIKSEMQLSALMGKQIDLSQVRQKFAQGDSTGAAEALRQQLKGVDMDKMNMFQRQALQQATGMDMDTLMKLGKGGKDGKLQTQQEQMVGSITNLQTAMVGKMDEYWKNGILLKDLGKDAAGKFWAADAAVKQATLAAQMTADLAEAKNKLGWIAVGIAAIAALYGGAKLIGKLLVPTLKKVGTTITSKVTQVFAKKGTEKIAQTGVKQFSEKQIARGFAGKEAKDLLLKQTGKNVAKKAAISTTEGLVTKTAVSGVQATAAKGGFNLLKTGGNLLKSAGPQILAAGLGMAGEYFGGQREAEGMAEGDRSKVNQGKAMKVGGQAAEYAGYGMLIGSIVPGLGTVVGGALGGVVGGIKGIWDNFFSEDAKKQEEALKKQEEAKLAQLAQQESAKALVDEQGKLRSELAAVATDEASFRIAMVAQIVEACRLLDIIAFGSSAEKVTKEIYLDGKKVTHQLYDKASILFNNNGGKK